MINTETNQFKSAPSIEELKEKIPEDAQGAVFQVGERITLRGHIFEVQFLKPQGMFLKPVRVVETRQARRMRERLAR